MRKPPPSIKPYPCPRGFERVTLDAYQVQAKTLHGMRVTLQIDCGGCVALNGLTLTPGEAYALAQALSDTSAYAAPLYVKPRVRVKSAHERIEG